MLDLSEADRRMLDGEDGRAPPQAATGKLLCHVGRSTKMRQNLC